MGTLQLPKIREIEQELGINLPRFYRKLLVEIGPGPFGEDSEIFHPLDIERRVDSIFSGRTDLFRPFVPFGCADDGLELWVIDALNDLSASIQHRVPVGEWPMEAWFPHETWVEVHLDPRAIEA